MTTQFIHVDSTYRNRLLYPNPSDFVVPYVSPTGTNIQTFMNPVSTLLPVYNFVFPYCSLSQSIDFFDNGDVVDNSSIQITITGGNSIQLTLDSSELELFLGELSNSNQNHATLVGFLFVYGTASPYQSSLIIAYDENSSTITLENELSIDLTTTDYGYIYNDSTASTIRLNGNLKNLLMYDTSNLYLYDATISEIIPVNLLNNRILELSNSFSSTWSINDFYIVFREKSPAIFEMKLFDDINQYFSYGVRSLQLVKKTINPIIGTIFKLYHSNTLQDTGVKIKWRANHANPPYEIVSNGIHVQNGDLLITEDAQMTFQVSTVYQVFNINEKLSRNYINTFFTPFLLTPMFKNSSLFVNNEISYNVFPIMYSSYSDAPSNYQAFQNLTGSAIIYHLEYNSVTDTTYIYINPYDSDILDRFENTSEFPVWWPQCLFSLNTSEQFCPLNYSGSMISSEESVCYEIKLINLIFPNTFLNGLKVLTSFFPYFLVEFSNLSYSYQNTNILLTNNPNAQKALFPIPISDVSSPLTSQFLNLSCPCGQIVKFKPNDSFHFRILYPNGETLTTYDLETLLPYTPNPLIQLSAVFSIKRIQL